MEAVPLFGHSPGQLAYVVGDVFFCADVILPENVLDKYRIPYLFSLTEHLAALERAQVIPHRVAVSGHGPILQAGQLGSLIDLNAALAHRVADAIVDLASTPLSAEEILAGALRRFGAPCGPVPDRGRLFGTMRHCRNLNPDARMKASCRSRSRSSFLPGCARPC